MAPSHQSVLEPLGPSPPDPDACRLEIAAVLEGRTHISGIGWRLSVPGGTDTMRTETRRYGRTLIFSELAALRGGLEEAARFGCRRLVVRSSDPLLAALFGPSSPARYRRARAAAERLRPKLARFESSRFESGTPADPELAHAVGEALDLGLHEAAEREEHRVHVMERIIERARDVTLAQQNGVWLANGRYRVQLDPMRCECPAWTARWARAPLAGRRAQRLPC